MKLLLVSVSVSLWALGEGLDCQGCDCPTPLRTRDDNDKETCLFMTDQNLHKLSACEVFYAQRSTHARLQTVCQSHGGHLPKIVDKMKRYEFATYSTFQLPTLP